MFVGSLFAQTQKSEKEVIDEWTNFAKTAVFENGKLKSVRIPVSGEGEKLLIFEYSEDDKSFTVIDEKGKRIKILLDNNRKISSVIFPNGSGAVYSWTQAPNGY